MGFDAGNFVGSGKMGAWCELASIAGSVHHHHKGWLGVSADSVAGGEKTIYRWFE